MAEKMKSNNTLNIDMSINFFEDLVVLLKELKDRREKEELAKVEKAAPDKPKQIKL